MDNNEQLLKTVYDGACMGKETLQHMIKRCKDENFKKCIADQFAEYHDVTERAEAIMGEHKMKPASEGSAGIAARASLRINLRVDATSSHMAEMVMQGCLMGIVDVARAIRECPNADDDVRALAKKLLAVEERAFRSMEDYL